MGKCTNTDSATRENRVSSVLMNIPALCCKSVIYVSPAQGIGSFKCLDHAFPPPLFSPNPWPLAQWPTVLRGSFSKFLFCQQEEEWDSGRGVGGCGRSMGAAKSQYVFQFSFSMTYQSCSARWQETSLDTIKQRLVFHGHTLKISYALQSLADLREGLRRRGIWTPKHLWCTLFFSFFFLASLF